MTPHLPRPRQCCRTTWPSTAALLSGCWWWHALVVSERRCLQARLVHPGPASSCLRPCWHVIVRGSAETQTSNYGHGHADLHHCLEAVLLHTTCTCLACSAWCCQGSCSCHQAVTLLVAGPQGMRPLRSRHHDVLRRQAAPLAAARRTVAAVVARSLPRLAPLPGLHRLRRGRRQDQ